MYKKVSWFAAALLMVAGGIGLSSCEQEDDNVKAPISITKVYLEDANSDVRDREVSFVRLQWMLRIEGSGFTGLQKVYINGYATAFNPLYVSDNSMLVRVSKDTPTKEASESERNTIRLVKDAGEATFRIDVKAASPAITSISHTMPQAGEPVTISGTGLVNVTKVVFPGEVAVTSGIVSDPDGEFCIVAVPSGVSGEGGSVLVECENGGAYSPAYFNFTKGILLNFDNGDDENSAVNSWGEDIQITDEDLEDAPIGNGNASQGKYCPHNPARIGTIPAGKNRNTEVWAFERDWRADFSFIDPATATDQVAIQFDLFVPDEWKGTGFLKICFGNDFNGGEWTRTGAYNYVPWLNGAEVVPFQTTGWQTVTVPISDVQGFDGKTFEDVLLYREGLTYAQFGFFFENSTIKLSDVTGGSEETEYPSSNTNVKVYTDNWRIVPLETPTYNEFND